MVDDLHSLIGSSSTDHRRCLTKTCRIQLDSSETKKTARSFRIGHPTDLLTPRVLVQRQMDFCLIGVNRKWVTFRNFFVIFKIPVFGFIAFSPESKTTRSLRRPWRKLLKSLRSMPRRLGGTPTRIFSSHSRRLGNPPEPIRNR